MYIAAPPSWHMRAPTATARTPTRGAAGEGGGEGAGEDEWWSGGCTGWGVGGEGGGDRGKGEGETGEERQILIKLNS